MLAYNEIKERTYIMYEGEPYEVTESHVARTQQRKPQNQVKMKNLVSGRSVTTTFQSSDKVEEADISKKPLQYLYAKPGRGGGSDEYWFCVPGKPQDRLTLPDHVIADKLKFIKANTEVSALCLNAGMEDEMVLGIEPPPKVDLKVTEAPPNIKGDTATGGNKVVTVETGANVNAPMFINVGDIIRVNTDNGEYTERVEKN